MHTQNAKTSSVNKLFGIDNKPSSRSNSEKKDDKFLSMVLNEASKKDSGLTKKDLKQIVEDFENYEKEVEILKTVSMDKISADFDEKIDENIKNELYENANFMQLLQVLEILNGSEKVSKFPNFTDKIAKFLSVPENVKELGEVKNIKDLIKLAEKFDLGLEKISVSKEDVKNLGSMFKNLNKKSFFSTFAKTNLKINPILKNEIEKNVKKTNSDETVKLGALLSEVCKKNKSKAKSSNIKNENLDDADLKSLVKKSDEKIKLEPKKDELSLKDLKKLDNSDLDSVKKVNISDKEKSTKEITMKVDNNQAKPSKSVTLQNLLYPEREQKESGNFANGDSFELGDIGKEVNKNAQSQLHHKLQVKRTFSNFSQNLAEQIQNYKAPFTKFNMKLNPLNLGEIDVTMINRGNNLHINFNSNTATMNLFLQNQAEFKSNLVNMGFTELQMNFSDQNSKQEQNKRGNKKLNHGENLEDGEGIHEQPFLELVMPRYI